MDIIQRIALDVSKDGIQANVIAVQGEKGSRTLAISLRNGGAPISFGEGISAAIRGLRPDGGEIFNSCIVYTENGAYPNTVFYHVTPKNVEVAGTFLVRLEVGNAEGDVLWSPAFSITVKENPLIDSDMPKQAEYTALLEALARAESAEKAAAWHHASIEETLGDIDAALDGILAIQEKLIRGETA